MTLVTHLRRALPAMLTFLSGMTVSGCDSTGPAQSGSLAISVTTRRLGVSPSSSRDVVIGAGPNSLKITKVEFVLAETELSQASACSNDDEEDDDCDEIELDPILVDLPLGTSPPMKVIDALVPAGTYTRLEAKLRAVKKGSDDDENGAAKFIAANPSWPSELSVRVAGVYTDVGGLTHDFTFTSSAKSKLEMAFASPIKVDANTENLTITVDVARWFKDAAGKVLDPTSSANASLINTNIRRSFKAFKDNDRDAHDDDNEDEDEQGDDQG